MAKRAPQPRSRTRADDDDADSGMTSFSDADSGADEDDDDHDDDDDADGDEDRGDDHDGTDDDDADEDDDDGEGEEEEEGDEDGDEGDEGEEDEGDEDDDADALDEIANPGGRVPLSRLNEVLEQNRKLTEMVMQMTGQGGNAPRAPARDDTPAFDLAAKIKERNAKLLEGDEDAASALDLEIETHRQQVATRTATAAVTGAMQQQAVDLAIAEVQRTYPVLNDKKRAFDQDTLDEVVALRNVYVARGDSMADAIAKAAKRICGRGKAAGGGEGKRGRDPEELTPRERRMQMLRAKRTPPPTHRQGASSRTVGATGARSENLTEREVKGMSEREKREARGDFDVRSAAARRRSRR